MMDFKVEYKGDNGEVLERVTVRRVPRSKYKDLINYSQELINSFVLHNAAVGSVIAEDSTWKTLIKLGQLLNVVDSSKGLDVARLENDLSQLCKIFFTQSISDEGDIDLTDGFKSPLVAELHQLDYAGALGNASKAREQTEKQKAVSETSPQVEIPTLISSP